ncbi:type I 3-dehydroquinate dehydratase [Georgenia sp. SYP-B2076]|uniref:type I 3-dehydroquinate dehydratase n=1 Tax=Georgenia sp. SYP-B2076 TaxID=2495881 RepID=UPI000F8D9DDD|nr:type I 3-dehydroquinate dehydratase [Georgenia sp. SYP-B2076]
MRTVALKNVVLGEGATKVIVPLTGTDAGTLLRQADGLAGHSLDIVEWRVDHYEDAPDAQKVVATARTLAARLAGRPLLVTFRTAAEGGRAAIEDGAYGDLLVAVARSGVADAVDVELFRDEAQVRRVVEAAHEAGVRVVMSSHDFAGTPAEDEIVARLRRMQDLGADVVKLAAMPHDAGDVLTLLGATWTMHSVHADRPVITMAMGGVGVVSRLAGEIFGSAATFGMVGEASAPGQVDVDALGRVLELIHRAR